MAKRYHIQREEEPEDTSFGRRGIYVAMSLIVVGSSFLCGPITDEKTKKGLIERHEEAHSGLYSTNSVPTNATTRVAESNLVNKAEARVR